MWKISVTFMPNEGQCISALSSLVTAMEKNPNEFCYVRFPFGIVDYDGMKVFQEAYAKLAEERPVAIEKRWLQHCRSTFSDKEMVDLDSIEAYFKENIWNGSPSVKLTQVRNLVGKNWITDESTGELRTGSSKWCDHTLTP